MDKTWFFAAYDKTHQIIIFDINKWFYLINSGNQKYILLIESINSWKKNNTTIIDMVLYFYFKKIDRRK